MKLRELEHPSQLKQLSLRELEQLAEEIRQVILETVARTGGHLAPNLGTVELTLALHTVFNSPTDKILWDVSHQSYPHKLVTGRFSRFHTLRKYAGIAGFSHPAESAHDHFHWGHAAAALSAGMGLAKARDLKGENFEVVCVVGDGALTGGMAYEALDHAGHDRTRLIMILNDNGMSIAPNVGGISHFLARIRTSSGYQYWKQQTAGFLKHIPVVGPPALDMVDRMKEGLKHLVIPTMFFEDLGLTYIGPVDGHNIPAMQEALRQARSMKEPVVVHVVTTKGKGVPYAEELPDKFHGLGVFDAKSGRVQPGSVSYSAVFAETLIRLAQGDERIVAITAAMPDGTCLDRFARAWPRRFFDVGIAEQHAAAFAGGLAKEGMRPVFAVYSTFLQRAYDQVIHDVVVQGVPVVLAVDRAGLVEDGATHQGIYDIAFLRCLPGAVLGAPKDENELQHMLATGLQHNGSVFALRYPRGKTQGVVFDPEPQSLPIGRAELLRSGKDLAIWALGTWAPVALAAAADLAAMGIDAAVVNPRWVKPLDTELLAQLARETGAILTVEEGVLPGGFGGAVLEALADLDLAGVRVRRLGIPDEIIPHGDPAIYHQQFGLSVAGIVAAARELVAAVKVELGPRPRRRRRGGPSRGGGSGLNAVAGGGESSD